MLSDADLDRLFGDDNALFYAAPKDTAIVIGGTELRVGHIAVSIKMHHREPTMPLVGRTQQGKGDRMIAAHCDREQARGAELADARLDRAIRVQDREGRKQDIAAIRNVVDLEGLNIELDIVTARSEARFPQSARPETGAGRA